MKKNDHETENEDLAAAMMIMKNVIVDVWPNGNTQMQTGAPMKAT